MSLNPSPGIRQAAPIVIITLLFRNGRYSSPRLRSSPMSRRTRPSCSRNCRLLVLSNCR